MDMENPTLQRYSPLPHGRRYLAKIQVDEYVTRD